MFYLAYSFFFTFKEFMRKPSKSEMGSPLKEKCKTFKAPSLKFSDQHKDVPSFADQNWAAILTATFRSLLLSSFSYGKNGRIVVLFKMKYMLHRGNCNYPILKVAPLCKWGVSKWVILKCFVSYVLNCRGWI